MSIREARRFSEKQIKTGEIAMRTWRVEPRCEGMEKLVYG